MATRSEVLRAEAARCLEMARFVSLEHHRQALLEMAARCVAEAAALEGTTPPEGTEAPGPAEPAESRPTR